MLPSTNIYTHFFFLVILYVYDSLLMQPTFWLKRNTTHTFEFAKFSKLLQHIPSI